MHFKQFNAGIALSLLFTGAAAQDNSSALPVVDLGYARHQASFFNVCHQYSFFPHHIIPPRSLTFGDE